MINAEHIQQVDRTYVRWRGRKLSYFGGCDYFRLSSHPKVVRAVQDGLKRYGLSTSASRRTTGNHALYTRLERDLAKFFGGESALVVGGGYSINQVVTQALAGDYSHALVDEYSHLAVRDAVKMLDCPAIKFRHKDADDLARKIRKCGSNARVLVITDGMFSYDGSVAPLAAYLKVMPVNALLMVDDAHGAGTVGRTGKGSVEVEGIGRRRVVQCLTLSKALGVYGGALICSRALRGKIVSRSHIYAGSTPLLLPLAYATCESLRLLRTDHGLRRRQVENVRWVRNALRKAGFSLDDTPGPIVSIIPKSPREAEWLRKELLKARILPPYLNYPNGPLRGYYRFIISSEHTREQLERMVRVLLGAWA